MLSIEVVSIQFVLLGQCGEEEGRLASGQLRIWDSSGRGGRGGWGEEIEVVVEENEADGVEGIEAGVGISS